MYWRKEVNICHGSKCMIELSIYNPKDDADAKRISLNVALF